MIALIVMIEVVLVLAGLMMMCFITRYTGEPPSVEERHDRVFESRYRS
ncbi:hypothetical protein [Streptosporangium sp. NPDC000396]